MKRILIFFPLFLLGQLAGAQGLIDFNNSASSLSKISVNATPGGAVSGLLPAGDAGAYNFALFYSIDAAEVNGSTAAVLPTVDSIGEYVTSDPNWTFAGAYATNITTAGRFAGNFPQVINGLAGGQTANFVVLGWSTSIGYTVSDVENWLADPVFSEGTVKIGESSVAAITLGDGVNYPTFEAVGVTTVPAFVLGTAPVPEPATIALAGLGGLAGLAFRRQKDRS